MKTTTTETNRKLYAAFLKFSGLDAKTFRQECEGVIHEIADGEEIERTPALWVRAAEMVAYDQTTDHGRRPTEHARFLDFQKTLPRAA